MAAAVHLVHICSSYISNTSGAGRLMLRDLIFFSPPLCHFLHPYCPILWCPFSMTIHTSVEIALNFDFSLNVILSSFLCLDITRLWFPATRRFTRTKCFPSCGCMHLRWLFVSKWDSSALLKPLKTLKKTASMPVIIFLFYLRQSELTNLHLMQAATCCSHSRAKRCKTDAIIYRHYSSPPEIAPTESPPAHEIHPPINLPSDHLLRPDLARSPWGDAWGLEAIFLLMELQGKPDLMILPCKQGWQFKSDPSVSVSRSKTSLQGIDLFILFPSGEKKRGCGQG